MAEEPSSGERTEEATAKRRSDFRSKGQVAQSKEVQTAALITVMLLFWLFYMPYFFPKFSEFIADIFQASNEINLNATSTMTLFFTISVRVGMLLLPLFFVVMVIGFFSSFLQIGLLFTTKPFQPDLNKFNPITGMARLISKKSALEIFKSIFKVSLIAYIAYSTVYDKFEEALILIDASIGQSLSFLGKSAALVLAKISAILIFLAFIDFLFVRYEMEEKMKMTKQEIKEEYKETEGDPQVKQQIRSIQRQMAQRRMMADVPKADVIVTNPTHISVAIRYDMKKMAAPTVIAKGAGTIAMNIRKIARENKVPIIENPPVARLLHKIEIGDIIPEELFKAVAEILAHVYSLKGKKL